MVNADPREDSALALLREFVALFDRFPAARVYLKAVEPLVPNLERRARKLVLDAEAPVKAEFSPLDGAGPWSS